MKDRRKFQSGSGCYVCRNCKKQTRETGGDESCVQLCRACWDDANWENHHSDECHDGAKESCPVCAEEGYGRRTR